MSQIPHEFAGPCPNARLISLSPFDVTLPFGGSPRIHAGEERFSASKQASLLLTCALALGSPPLPPARQIAPASSPLPPSPTTTPFIPDIFRDSPSGPDFSRAARLANK